MGRRVIDISRRQVLRGAGGVTLALPVLPSLLTRTAYGADPVFTRPPRLYWITTDHGGAFEESMFPRPSMLTTSEALFSDHTVRSGALTPMTSGTDTVLSPVLRAPSSSLPASLVRKMNVLWGLDVPFYIAHNTGLHLGNYARNDGNGEDGQAVQEFPRPTIDQIMAWSPSFYPDLSGIRERAMVMAEPAISWNYTDPAKASGAIQHVRGYSSSLELFKKIFVPSGGPAPRAPIVDRVLASYNRLRNGNRRLSVADRQRLDDHVARIAELQRKLTSSTGGGAGASCSSVMMPSDDAEKHMGNSPAEAARQLQLWNDVVVAAFMCGTSRIAVLGHGDTSRYVSYGGDWHDNVAHQWRVAEPQAVLVQSYQRFFASVFVEMARRLDSVEEVPGLTYLDHSLLVWTQESGMETHGAISVPVVTFGSAAGRLKTGLLCDYRRMGNPASEYEPDGTPGPGGTQTLGLLYGQWLATVLQAMGLPPSEFERWGHKGYGYPYVSTHVPPLARHYTNTSSRYFQGASNWLPFLKA